MFDVHHFALFLTAAVMLAITPGPGILYVLARSVAGGKREGVLSSLGTFIGGLVHVVAAAAGLSVVLATSAFAFSVVKYTGAAYLIYLGIKMILSRQDESPELPQFSGSKGLPLSQGALTEILNPKTALFFLSFIPQFVDHAQGHVFFQFLILGTISVALNTTVDLLVVWMSGPLSHRLRGSASLRRTQRRATGGVMIALGTYLALSDSR